MDTHSLAAGVQRVGELLVNIRQQLQTVIQPFFSVMEDQSMKMCECRSVNPVSGSR